MTRRYQYHGTEGEVPSPGSLRSPPSPRGRGQESKLCYSLLPKERTGIKVVFQPSPWGEGARHRRVGEGVSPDAPSFSPARTTPKGGNTSTNITDALP